jgi:hypothetical protein
LTAILLGLTLAQLSRIGNDYWITVWINKQIPGFSEAQYQWTYALWSLVQAFFMVITGMLCSMASAVAAEKVHRGAISKVFAVRLLILIDN